ncbi:MAG: M56 family metallopeptidase [Chitinophagaceae bacterium]|nr:M56 family metallopeptidase [Chitinophagaceae bacterium]
MHDLILYLLKSGISLGAVYLFYQWVLRRMTFYTWNRWYLLIYSLLAFLLPLINIAPVLEKKEWEGVSLVEWIPSVTKIPSTTVVADKGIEPLTMFLWVVGLGIAVLALRFLIQLISFQRLRKQAVLIEGEGTKLYQVDKPIIPFSFGNSIYLNPGRHDEAELKEIIRHEFVHVRQNHTMDMLWAEWICILNWYNPFAWLLRKAIRQNLEFIADQHVTDSGVDRKQYQYLLLKVMGQHAYRMAPGFNFSSLKTRIAMMNKIRTHKVHLLKFLVALPLAALLLITFRSEKALAQVAPSADVISPATPAPSPDLLPAPAPADRIAPRAPKNAPALPDTIPATKKINDKGYLLSIADNQGECVVIIKNNSNKILKAIALTEWNANEKEYIAKYGELPPAPPAPPARPDPIVVEGKPLLQKAIVKQDGVIGVKEVVVVGYPTKKGVVEDKKQGEWITLMDGAEAPIYIVNGEIVESKWVKESVKATDIESINILKGESATTKYGDKAKHGAIEIKMKKKE